jgi:cell division septal protein FtsQ
MAWRRRRDAVSGDSGDSGDSGTSTGHHSAGEHSVPGEVLADDAVLDELSRAFAADREHDDSDPPPAEPEDPKPSPEPSPSQGIISIVGDDLPDAAYLDDELERDSSSSQPIFIDDDGGTDAILPQQASTRGIEPRIRQRRIGVKRSANRRRLWWLALAAVVLVVVIGVLALLGSSMFAVERVTVTGNVYTDQAALDAVIEDLTGTAVLLVDTDAVEAQVEAIPWVRDARVRTSFPDSASIEIRERTPVAAMMGADGSARVLDVEGRVLTLVEGQPVALVWISGPGTLDVAPGQFASIGYSAAASLVTKLTPDIRSRVESMLVTPDGADLVLVLTSERGPVEVRFGSALGENSQIEKLVRLQRTLDDVDTKPVTVIDVSTAEVTVR